MCGIDTNMYKGGIVVLVSKNSRLVAAGGAMVSPLSDIKGLHVFCIRKVSSVRLSPMSNIKVIYAFCTLIYS